MDRLSTEDMINLAVATPQAPMQVGAVIIFEGRSLYGPDGKLRLGEISAAIQRRLHRAPALRRVILSPGFGAGRPLWVDDMAFGIEHHVQELAASRPLDREALLSLATQLLARPLDRRHPPWRIWFITGLPDAQVAAVIALHHVVADGVAAIGLIGSLLDPPGQAEPGPDPMWIAKPAPSRRELVRDNVQGKLAALRRIRVPNPGLMLRRLMARGQVLARSIGAPRTSLNAVVGAGRRLTDCQLDLNDARRIAHLHGAKINDVVLSLAAAGVRTLLQSRGEQVTGKWLHVSVAVSLRGADNASGTGNRTGGIMVRLPVGEADPHRRLRLVAAETAQAKRRQAPTTGNSLLAAFARVGLLRLLSRHQRMTNLVESNVKGPAHPLYLLGAPARELLPIGNLVGNLALSFLAISYTGRLTIAIQADAGHFPDLALVPAAISNEWDLLLAQARDLPREAGGEAALPAHTPAG